MNMQHSVRFILSAVVSLLACSLAAAQSTDRPILAGDVVSDSLAPGELHVYSIDLEAEQFLFGDVDQRSVDVVVSVFRPNGELARRFDAAAHGRETFQFQSRDAGTHRIEIGPFESNSGQYTLTLRHVGPSATTPEGIVEQLIMPYSGNDRPGGVVAVVRNGDLAFARAFGMANLTHEIPFTVDTRTNIGSTSKQFTGFAIALLASRGKVSLDDDVRMYLPELKDFGRTVTLRHLLSHTSGYREIFNTLAIAGRRLDLGDAITRDEFLSVVQRQPDLQNEPGAEFNYNNTGYGLLARVIEEVSGLRFDEWMRENIFLPLGMDSTLVRMGPEYVVTHSAQGYRPAEGGYREVPDLSGAAGAGGIYTTVEDLARWSRNLSTAAVGGEAVKDMLLSRFELTDGDTTNYGLGVFIDEYRGLRRIHHGGADNAHRSMFAFYPDLAAAVIVLSNDAAFPMTIADRIADAFFGDEMSPLPESKPRPDSVEFDPDQYAVEDFDHFAGRYEMVAAPGFILSFMREGGRLFTQATGQQRIEIFPTSDTTFALRVVEASVTFHRNADGTVSRLTLHQNGEHAATRLHEAQWSPSDEDLRAYTGRYYSAEIETFYNVELRDSTLVLKHRRLEDNALEAVSEDTFSGRFPAPEISFVRDAARQVTGFQVSNGRTRGVSFRRLEANFDARQPASAPDG